ncbi:MAG: LysM peptidoglycan-binding domain-containing protein [Chloroflexi bacterium]|nr:LysM peptidoglycan-binding domain-containing protein [Chloroflexota bacterium]
MLILAGSTLAACASEATPSAEPSPAPAAAESAPSMVARIDDDAFCPSPRGWFVYITKPGDTLQSIAGRTASTVHELATANCLQNPRALASGLTLYVPARPVGD